MFGWRYVLCNVICYQRISKFHVVFHWGYQVTSYQHNVWLEICIVQLVICYQRISKFHVVFQLAVTKLPVTQCIMSNHRLCIVQLVIWYQQISKFHVVFQLGLPSYQLPA